MLVTVEMGRAGLICYGGVIILTLVILMGKARKMRCRVKGSEAAVLVRHVSGAMYHFMVMVFRCSIDSPTTRIL